MKIGTMLPDSKILELTKELMATRRKIATKPLILINLSKFMCIMKVRTSLPGVWPILPR